MGSNPIMDKYFSFCHFPLFRAPDVSTGLMQMKSSMAFIRSIERERKVILKIAAFFKEYPKRVARFGLNMAYMKISNTKQMALNILSILCMLTICNLAE